jgi:hypothetical protein
MVLGAFVPGRDTTIQPWLLADSDGPLAVEAA